MSHLAKMRPHLCMAQMGLLSHVQALNSWVPRISSVSKNLALTGVGPTVELDANIYL